MAGRYKILEELGAGGAGAVFKAYDTQLNRYVAVKRLLTREEADKENAESGDLQKEAASLATLQHPNIVSIFDLANDEDGFFIVMELLDGDTLADWIKDGPMTLKDFYELATQTLEAILTAHHQNILHRDLKPENIKVLRLPGGRLQAKVLDFGLARLSYGARKMTEDQSGNVMGSIYYMAPEQLMRKPVDARTDLYAMGCLFYHALSGRRPFEHETVQGIMDQHLHHHVYPLKELAPNVPDPISDWVMWMINLAPEHRPQSAQEALNYLKDVHKAGWFKTGSDEIVAVALPDEPIAVAVALDDDAPIPVKRTTTQHLSRKPTGAVSQRLTGTASQRLKADNPKKPTANIPKPGTGGVRAVQVESSYAPTLAGINDGPIRSIVQESIEPFEPKEGLPKWIWPAAAAALLILGLGFGLQWKRKSDEAAETLSKQIAKATRPAGLITPGGISHYLVGQRMDAYADQGKPVPEMKVGELVKNWHDIQNMGGNAILSAFELKREACPKFVQEKVEGITPTLNLLRFSAGNGLFNLTDKNRPESREFPFGANTKQKGVTLFMLVRPNISGKEVTVLRLANQDGQSSLVVRAYPDNEFRLIITVGKAVKEIKATGRDVSKFNLLSIVWDGAANKASLTVRTQDGGKVRVESEAPKAANLPVLNDLKISETKAGTKPEDTFTGDFAELLIWPFPMKWEDRNLQDWKLSEYYFTSPGARY